MASKAKCCFNYKRKQNLYLLMVLRIIQFAELQTSVYVCILMYNGVEEASIEESEFLREFVLVERFMPSFYGKSKWTANK